MAERAARWLPWPPRMLCLRLFVFDGSDAIERTYSRFPVRVGRHPRNECQILDPRVSRFHAQFEVEQGQLVVRDVASQNGTLLLEGASDARVLRATSNRSTTGQLAVAIGGLRVQARLVICEGPELPDTFAPAAREAARALLSVCPLQGERAAARVAGLGLARPVLDGLWEGVFLLLMALRGDAASGEVTRNETTSALLKWIQANTVALRLLGQALDAAEEREQILVEEAVEALDAVLYELAPERIESQTHDVSKAWPASRATAVWARYVQTYRRLSQRHARRPSLLLGRTLAALDGDRASSERASEDEPIVQSERRAKAHAQRFIATSSDTGEQPPSSH